MFFVALTNAPLTPIMKHRNIPKNNSSIDRIFLFFMIDFKQKMQEVEKLEKKNQSYLPEEEQLINSRKRRRITTYAIAILVIALVFSGKILIFH